MSKEVAGILPIIHTPFIDDDTIDYKILEKEIDWIFETGSHGYCSAMVSEYTRLSHDERIELNTALADLNKNRGVVVASVGSETSRESAILARSAEDAGCHAVMAIPPIITSLPAHSKMDYYRAIADAVSIPLIVQDASGYLGAPLGVDLQADLLKELGPDKVMFKPEANPCPSPPSLKKRKGNHE